MSITTRTPNGSGRWAGLGILAVCLLGMGAVAGGTFLVLPSLIGERAPIRLTLGGPFRLLSSKGGVLDSASLAGRPYLVFFGFTNCPNVCPTTLADLGNLIDGLAEQGTEIRAVYVTLDPEQDTQDVMRAYMSSFSERITGLTGTREEIAALARAFHVHVERVPLPNDRYTIEHSLTVFLMDGHGQFAEPLDLAAGHRLAGDQIRRVIAQSEQGGRGAQRAGAMPGSSPGTDVSERVDSRPEYSPGQ